MKQLTEIASSIITFINTVAVPLIFAVAFIVFLFGVFRYYIVGGANPEARKNGHQLIMYSIIGFAVMIVVWGLVNLVVHTFNFSNNTRPDLPTFGQPTDSSVKSSNESQPAVTSKDTANSKLNSDSAKVVKPTPYTPPTQGFVGPPN